jgi:16S rRNA (uracil1498-N3)-methyltransferase
MRIPRFFCSTLTASQKQILLPDTVHRHAVQVLRLKPGAVIRLFDGKGIEFEATLTRVERKRSEAELTQQIVIPTESQLQITLLQGISRGERMDFAIQKAVELGVNRIVPIVTERCNVQLGQDRKEKRQLHWQGVMTSACEQSGRAFLPELAEIKDLNTALQDADDALKLVLDPQANSGFRDLAQPEQLTLLIGPEGGLTDDEINTAKLMGFTAVKFGPRILRTETASTAALAVVQTLWGDLA